MTQPPAPIEFKSNAKLNDTTKYYIPETDDNITNSPISKVPTEEASTGYLIDNIPEEKSIKSSSFTEETQIPETQSTEEPEHIQNRAPEHNTKDELEKELSQMLESKPTIQKTHPKEEESKTTTLAKELTNPKATNQISNFIKPVEGNIIEKFSSQHQGITIATNLGEPIKAIGDGQVVYSGYDNKFGNLIIIKLKQDDFFAAFAYMEDLILSKGTQVTQGQVIGHVGQSGTSENPQLYLAIKKGKIAVDPAPYFNY